jgi:DNA-binding phage protein
VAELPVVDPAPYFDSREVITAYLNDILAAGHAALLEGAVRDVIRTLQPDGSPAWRAQK